VDFIEEGNTHAPLTGEVSTPAVLFAGGLALGALTAQTLQKRVNIRQQEKQCEYNGA
jgi:hypothetical protein